MAEDVQRVLLEAEKDEITEHHIYRILSRKVKGKNRELLEKLSAEELKHYEAWKKYTGVDVKPDKLKVIRYGLISKIFGLTFAIKLMEYGEFSAQERYKKLVGKVYEAEEILKDEIEHEKALISMIDEEKIRYIGSMVLGLNDALVEITGSLAGLTFALQNTSLIGIAGLITGFAASLSMASSEYLSQRSEGGENPTRAAIYTGIAYIVTVLLLVAPYMLQHNPFMALLSTMLIVVGEISIFSFFISIVRELSTRKTFLETLGVSLGVAAISFLIGWAVKNIFNIEF